MAEDYASALSVGNGFFLLKLSWLGGNVKKPMALTFFSVVGRGPRSCTLPVVDFFCLKLLSEAFCCCQR